MGFFDLFRKAVPVKCYDLDELAKILEWHRSQYLSRIADVEFPVTVVTNGIFDAVENGPKVLYFIVHIPYIDYKGLREKFIESEAFDPILQQEALTQIMDRGLS